MDLRERIYNISEMLLVFTLTIILATIVFLTCGISVGYANFFLPVICIFFFRYKFLGGKEYFVADCVACIALLAFFILFAGGTYDNTWDGAAYHKTAVGLLKEGWNPFYMGADQYNDLSRSIEPTRDNPLLWAEAYPKATWYYAAAVYYLTGNIECGKSYTLVFAFITFGICVKYFSKKTGKKRAYVLSGVAALNPIVCAQFQSYYLDGVVACVLTSLIIKFLALLDNNYEDERAVNQLSIFALIVWGCNMKFNVALYIMTICAIYCVCLSIRNKKVEVKKTFVLVIEGVVSIFVVGVAPYITNIKRHQSIFYGFDRLLDEQAFQSTFGIQGLNNLGRFWVSVFGKTSHGQYSSLSEVLKIPFTYDKEELIYYSIPDTRVAGLGIMFSGLFLIASIVLTAVLIEKLKKKEYTPVYIYTVLIWIVSMIEFCLVPQTSQFRYIPHLYLIVPYALYYIFKHIYDSKLWNAVGIVCIVVIMVNLAPWAKVSVQRIDDGVKTAATMKYMGKKCSLDSSKYYVAFYCDDFTGMHFNLKDQGINYTSISVTDIDDEYNTTCSNWLYYKKQ